MCVRWTLLVLRASLLPGARLAPFQPCFVRRAEQYVGPLLEGCASDTAASGMKSDQDCKGLNPAPEPATRKYLVDYKTEEIWYPGECTCSRAKSVSVANTGGSFLS